MKLLIVLSVAFACASAQRSFTSPTYGNNFEKDAVILKQVFDLNPVDNSYVSSYETSNGIRVDEQGYLKNAGSQAEAQVMQGSYSYTGPDGVVYTITYIADENGYRAEGAHIPTPPPVAPASAGLQRRPAPSRFNFNKK
ncbi:CLUMA_CG013193, isoform A [Clunio marinus]|uniref:CLUMA_CG013193, isoform A n=1 Tax=Clunio marinus TaxID=568069 RepID=A0A1J1IJF0_9DIPT|nr:CLUMA_CG013193, isoform A [Clunio marinus]